MLLNLIPPGQCNAFAYRYQPRYDAATGRAHTPPSRGRAPTAHDEGEKGKYVYVELPAQRIHNREMKREEGDRKGTEERAPLVT